MIESHLAISVRPGPADLPRLLELFRTERILERSVEHGCLEVEMLRSREDASGLVVRAQWADLAGYQSWVGSALRERWQPRIDELTYSLRPTTFDVLHRVRSG